MKGDGVILEREDLHANANWSHAEIASTGGIVYFQEGRPDLQEDEFLQANGFDDIAWTAAFDAQDYLNLNPDLVRHVTRSDALKHFGTIGIDQLRQFTVAEWFDLDFYSSLLHFAPDETPEARYRHWLTVGRPAGKSSNETMFLRRLGLHTPRVPASFVPDRANADMSADRRAGAEIFASWVSAVTHGEFSSAFTDDRDCAMVLQDIGGLQAARGDHSGAVKSLTRAVSYDGSLAQSWRWLGDSHLALADHTLAQLAYRNVVTLGAADAWAYRNLAAAESHAGRLDASLATLRQAAALFPEDAGLRDDYSAALTTHFERIRWEAVGRYAATRGASGTGLFEGQLERLPEWHAIATPSMSPRSDSKPRVIILANHSLAQCYRYRVQQKIEQLTLLNYEHAVVNMDQVSDFMNIVHEYSIAIFFRVPWTSTIAEAVQYARSLGLATVYDVDDLIFEPTAFPAAFESYGGQLSFWEFSQLVCDTPLYQKAMMLCDYGLASTKPLREFVSRHVRKRTCFLHVNGFDSLHEVFFDVAKDNRSSGADQTTIFYGTGTRAHNDAFEQLVAPALVSLMAEDPSVRLVIVGSLTIDGLFNGFENRVERIDPIWNTNIYYQLLSEADISIAPLLKDAFTDCKSEIKWLEAAMFEIPSVVSDTLVYREVTTDGVDALIAGSAESWEAQLKLLARDRDLRARMGRAAKDAAFAAYRSDHLARSLQRVLLELSPPAKLRRKKRIAVVNVFFWPQMNGGATRVVRDNIDYLVDHHGETCDFDVFCASEGARDPYAVRVYDYRGCRVTSVSHPVRDDIDWLERDPTMGAIFARWVQQTGPDLIHFHCIQRLTGSVVEAAIQARVPYLVTVHDAWWIADNRFFLGEGGVVSDKPRSAIDLMAQSAERALPSLTRSTNLRSLLRQARRILAVSKPFAEVYAAFGIRDVAAVDNGVSPIEVLPKRREAGAPVVMALLGGTDPHKGLPIIERALRSTVFNNLCLIVIDHRRAAGTPAETLVWGTTRVEFRARVHQKDIATLYQEIDVLLAPSIWPEPYGLVAREALLSGVWVVASDRGAIGNDVVDGQNGFVVNVDDTQALVAVLKVIDGDAQRFTQPPPDRTPLRTSDQQGEDLWALYMSIVQDVGAVPAAQERSIVPVD